MLGLVNNVNFKEVIILTQKVKILTVLKDASQAAALTIISPYQHFFLASESSLDKNL